MIKKSKTTRMPAAAGIFYPSQKNALINQINGFLAKTKKIKTKKRLKILLLPHAGYDFSGLTAAWGIKQISNENFKKIILIGSSHQAYFSYAAVDGHEKWQTPPGKTEVEKKLAVSLIKQSNFFKITSPPHRYESSLEIQLPFLQQVLPKFKILPVLLGEVNRPRLTAIANILAAHFDRQTLFVISANLSHYPDYKTAEKIDRQTIKAILSGKTDNFIKTSAKNLGINGLETRVDASAAIILGMEMLKKIKAGQGRLFYYTNSGAVTNNKTRVVGYCCLGFY